MLSFFIHRADDQIVAVALAAELLAEMMEVNTLMILTEVEKVAINFNKPDQQELAEMTIEEARKHIADKQFAPGSMLPKVESCIAYVENTENGQALITSLQRAKEALKGETGTIIHR